MARVSQFYEFCMQQVYSANETLTPSYEVIRTTMAIKLKRGKKSTHLSPLVETSVPNALCATENGTGLAAKRRVYSGEPSGVGARRTRRTHSFSADMSFVNTALVCTCAE